MKLLLFLIWSLISVLDGQTLSGPKHGMRVVCYVAAWATYRPQPGNFNVDDLDPSMCTHLIYSFAGLDETKNSIKSLDPWQDLEKNSGLAGYKGMVALKERYPHLKVSIAIGGWNEGSSKYSNMAAHAESREAFIKSVMLFLKQYGFDGLDLDWEYPTQREGKPYDKENFVHLVKELKEAFEPYNYLLTSAFGAGKSTMEAAYDLSKLSRHLDFMHIMAYDYHGTWDGVVGANAPLKGITDDDVLSVEHSLKYMISQGVSPYKLVLGLPMYGRTFILTDPHTKEIVMGKTPVQAIGFKGPYTGDPGYMGYNEICQEVSNTSSQWSQHWDERSSTPYIHNADRVISYDNSRSIAIKVKTAADYGLGGVMVWSIDTDDFRGICPPEEDALKDFVDRHDQLRDDPLVNEALKALNLPDANRIDKLSKGVSYVVSEGKLALRLPQRPPLSNYNLLRTINEAATLAMQEKRIKEEMARVTKDNEIKPEDAAAKCSTNMLRSWWLTALGVALIY